MALNAANSIQAGNERILVLGLGTTGYSVVKYLVKAGSDVTVADSRELPPYLKQVKDEFPNVETITGQIPYQWFDSFNQIVTSPGIEIEPQNSNRAPLIGDVELFVRQAEVPIIAITGSNGKSTVTMLVAEMILAAGLKVKTGGNIGTPVLNLLDQTLPDYNIPDYYVLELSSFQLEATYSLNARSATVLNISADHMDRYPALDDYIAAKKRIFDNANQVVVNRDDLLANPLASQNAGQNVGQTSFGLDAPQANHQFGVSGSGSSRALLRGRTSLARVEQITLQGEQNIANILAAMALVETAGVALTPVVINAALNYGGLPHRCEIVAEVNGVKWINDSKGTNAGATVAAITGFQQDIILIAGGKGKGADFSQLAKVIDERVKHTILFGEDAEIIRKSFAQSVPSTRVDLLKQAVVQARKMAQAGSVVLFSPACASFDMFDNYEHRGNVFKQLVWELVH